jgi:hypothetical protein
MHKITFSIISTIVLFSLNTFVMAAILPPTLPAVIDFTSLTRNADGRPNLAPAPDTGRCQGVGVCYEEDGFIIGVVENGGIEHLHAVTGKLSYHADSTGIYVRAKDSSAFSLDSLDLFAPIKNDNPIYGGDTPTFQTRLDGNGNPILDDNGEPMLFVTPPVSYLPSDIGLLDAYEYWEILGFNTALNPDLAATGNNGTDYSTRIAYQTVANGFSGTVALNADFQNINAFWIHYHGYPQAPINDKDFAMQLDNIVVSAPVPLPAAVWFLVQDCWVCLV